MSNMDYSKSMELIEACMDWIAQRWTKSMIKRELREWFPDINITTIQTIIALAKKEIRIRYNVDPTEYKGKQISFYEWVIRNKKAKMRDKLTAMERLDKLFGLENMVLEDADAIAERVRRALNEIDNNQFVGVPDDVRNKTQGESEINQCGTATSEQSAGADGKGQEGQTSSPPVESTQSQNANSNAEDSNMAPPVAEKDKAVLDALELLDDDKLNQFIKRKKNKTDMD